MEGVTIEPERYDGDYIKKNFRELRERRLPKLKPGTKVRYVVPMSIYEGEVIEVCSNTVTLRVKGLKGCAVQTTAEYVIPLKVEQD